MIWSENVSFYHVLNSITQDGYLNWFVSSFLIPRPNLFHRFVYWKYPSCKVLSLFQVLWSYTEYSSCEKVFPGRGSIEIFALWGFFWTYLKKKCIKLHWGGQYSLQYGPESLEFMKFKKWILRIPKNFPFSKNLLNFQPKQSGY